MFPVYEVLSVILFSLKQASKVNMIIFIASQVVRDNLEVGTIYHVEWATSLDLCGDTMIDKSCHDDTLKRGLAPFLFWKP